MPSEVVFLLVAAALTPVGGVFAAIDEALTTASQARVADLVSQGRGGARRLEAVLEQRPTYVALVVVVRVICETAATAFAAVALVSLWGSGWGLLAAIGLMTVVSFVAVGVGPRTLGRQHAYTIGIVSAPVLQAIGILLKPLTRLLILIGNAVTPGKGFRNGPFATEIELREVVDMATERGVVEDDERRMIQSVIDLADTHVREIMVPRPEMVWIEQDKNAAQAASLAIRSGHSRLPVIGENPDDIRGVVYLKDVTSRAIAGLAASVDVADVMRPAQFIPDSKTLDRVLADMQRTRNHMAMLVDEYGGIAGLVTIEDVLEEIVGEIADEYDRDEVAPVTELDDGGYRVSSRLPVEDLGELFDIDIDDDVETVGGLVGLVLGRVPLPGAQVQCHGLNLVAEGGPNRQGRQRITSVVVTRIEPEESDDEPAGERHDRHDRHDKHERSERKRGIDNGAA
ncbi:MAG TPA: hemolysin family protein [Gordonia sp. (in: high G+C Gram-positive bacteria)]|uniref:hemolysin family protein n=1 Tax=unclassified Gordonia (in: high G+C Gram-positive bacteria) TaxID=2657482 RepID=UPI000F9E792E|nr:MULTISPECIES: hemolysin family protein [unclassified Gordonia (in: high G+C Gram-positive bacteria)]RUP41583.1 MAG: HlyC/CorC family transporter [Gordonia sp. (in: high G+C Gram-positive bacteria)]HNP56675.1 hemolysin family protein [Gordonia sp. (in: high G+C Gram-positive bacteria)]HRC52396.1 hemolysin family protein [Gordonia sp. (in: high G+C Gram-positive bacteria)]